MRIPLAKTTTQVEQITEVIASSLSN